MFQKEDIPPFEEHERPNADPKQKTWTPKIDYTDFRRSPVEKPKPIIFKLLDDRSRMLIGGGSKTYKSWVMIEQAVCIACGARWWGFSTQQSNVLYVNFELKPYYCQRRFNNIVDFKALEVPHGRLQIWNLWNEAAKLDEFEKELRRLINLDRISVAYIDPFYCLLGEKDERVSAELMPVLSMFSRINRDTGASIVCACHFTKGNQAAKDPIDRISGGASMGRNPECIMTLTKHKEDHAFTVDFIVRDFEPINNFVVAWNHPLLVRTDELNPEDIKKPSAGRNTSYCPDQILEILGDFDDQLNTKELQEKVSEESGMSRSKFYELFESLVRQKKIFRSKATDKWNIQ